MRNSTTIAFITAGLAATHAQAQTDEPFELNPIILSAEDPNDVEISGEDLARIEPTDLADVFRTEPTVAVGSSIPMSQKLYVNGIEETNLAYTIDGARQNNKIFHHNATTLIDPDLLKSVRIDPGVAPADAGPGALAGSIAFETKDVGDLLPEGRTLGGFVTGEYISNGEIFSGSGAVYGRANGVEVLGYLKYADGGLREDGDGNDIVGSGTSLLSGVGKIAYQADSGDRIELSFETVNDDDLRPYRANIGEIIGGRPVPLTRNYDLERQNVVLSYTDATPTDLWNPTVRLAFSGTDLSIDEAEQLSYGKTESINGTIQNEFAVGQGSVTVGADFYKDEAELDYRYLLDRAFDEYSLEKSDNVGVFAQARLHATDQLRLSFGARADFQTFEGVDGSSFDDSGLSGNFSADYDVTPGTTISAGYSHVWGGVPLAENFIMNPAWTYPDEGIEAVTSRNAYLAVQSDFGPWSVGGKVFRTSIDNARTPGYTAGPAVTADVESKGYELGIGYNWTGGFVAVKYADIDTEIGGNPADSYTGQYLATPVGQILTIEAAHAINDGLVVGADAEIVFDLDDTHDSVGGPGEPLPGYEVVNAYLEYQPRRAPGLTIRGEISNLFDETYVSRATYGQEFGTVVPLREPGRSVALSATMRF